MNKSKRMQIKACLCLLGVVILLVIVIMGIKKQVTSEVKEYIPIVRELNNVWITEITDNGVRLFDGMLKEYEWQDITAPLVDRSAREQIADITLTDEKITDIHIKNQEKVSGKVVSINAGVSVELEEKGVIEFAPDMKLYRLYDTLALSSEGDIRIGYSFCDYVLEDGKICAVLVTRDEAMEYIRVQIKASNYASSSHESIRLSVDTDYKVRYGVGETAVEEMHAASDVVEINGESAYFTADRVYIVPEALTGKTTLLSVERSQGTPSYRGTIEIVKKEQEGVTSLYVINELLLEEYLYAVVPSEMPSSYPSEALKAQAICARTYAYGHMLQASNKSIGTHVDDSAGYQVYNNILEQESTTNAVKATSGQLLYVEGDLVNTYYYSTSCGFGSNSNVWKGGTHDDLHYLYAKRLGEEISGELYTAESMMQEETFKMFINTNFKEDYESEEAWYRWTYTVKALDKERMLQSLQSRYNANSKLILTQNKAGEYVSEPIESLADITDINIDKRNDGGVADELIIETKKEVYKVISEHNIRYILCDGVTKIVRQDGSKVDMATLLPSAFFTITTTEEKKGVIGYTLNGGGFGHGVGMSQNGAKCMAKMGNTAEDILTFFYMDGYLKNMY